MSPKGTAAYDGVADVPPLVERAVSMARQDGFDNSCRPEHGRLLSALAAGADAIGETGTGYGVGLAWLFSGLPQVTVIHADWHAIFPVGPFDLLVLDGGARKGGPGQNSGAAADPALLVRPGGIVVIDDLTPARHWPPRFEGQVDEVRTHWLSHPGFDAAELRLAPDLAALVATRRFPARQAPD